MYFLACSLSFMLGGLASHVINEWVREWREENSTEEKFRKSLRRLREADSDYQYKKEARFLDLDCSR